MEQQLFDAELHVMRLLWSEGDKSAKELVTILRDSIGWNKNTTYTVIKRLVQKGAIERIEPGFICHPLISAASLYIGKNGTVLAALSLSFVLFARLSFDLYLLYSEQDRASCAHTQNRRERPRSMCLRR